MLEAALHAMAEAAAGTKAEEDGAPNGGGGGGGGGGDKRKQLGSAFVPHVLLHTNCVRVSPRRSHRVSTWTTADLPHTG